MTDIPHAKAELGTQSVVIASDCRPAVSRVQNSGSNQCETAVWGVHCKMAMLVAHIQSSVPHCLICSPCAKQSSAGIWTRDAGWAQENNHGEGKAVGLEVTPSNY